MVKAATLAVLQIKRRQLENELTSLSSKELELICDLQKLEEAIIVQLEEKIRVKKRILSDLEAQKSDLERKLCKLKDNELCIQELEESFERIDDEKPVEECNDEKFTVAGILLDNVAEELLEE